MKDYDKKKKKVAAAMTDPWTRKFVNGVCDVFGVPASSLECNNASDRLMFSWAMLHVARAFKDYPDLLDELQVFEPAHACEEFVRRIYDMTGEMIIPSIPVHTGSRNNPELDR